jgi:hypothetical protein
MTATSAIFSMQDTMAPVDSISPAHAIGSIQPQHEALPTWLNRLGTNKPKSALASRRYSSSSDTKTRANAKKRVSRDTVSPKRARHLERNRVAANKCRMKRKEEQTQIQNVLEVESEKHDMLMAEVDSLREQAWELKNQIFSHAQCGDGKIDYQLEQMSHNVLQTYSNLLIMSSPASSTISSIGWSGDFAVEDSAPQNPVADQPEEINFDSYVNVPM